MTRKHTHKQGAAGGYIDSMFKTVELHSSASKKKRLWQRARIERGRFWGVEKFQGVLFFLPPKQSFRFDSLPVRRESR